MKLSDEQKWIITKIRDGEIVGLSDYVVKNPNLKVVPNNGRIRTEGGGTFGPDIAIRLVENEADIASRMHGFIALCNRLSGLGLVEIIKSVSIRIPALVVAIDDELYRSAQSCLDIYRVNSEFSMVPTHELSNFIDNNYMTAEELEREDRRLELESEKSARKRSELITISIAILSMIVSVALAYFNYKTYTNERKVYIENLSSMKLPIEVKIVDGMSNQGVKKDTPEEVIKVAPNKSFKADAVPARP